MATVKECDVCGYTYELDGGAINFQARIKTPLTYRVWKVLPFARDKVGFVTQDLCPDCKKNLEQALKELKQEQND